MIVSFLGSDYENIGTLDQIKNFIKTEIEEWTGFINQQNESLGKYPDKRVRSHWSSLVQEANQLQVIPLQDLQNSLVNSKNFEEARPLFEAFAQRSFILARSPKGKKILSEKSSIKGVLLLAHWNNASNAEVNFLQTAGQIPSQSIKFLHSYLIESKFDAFAFENGIAGLGDAERNLLAAVKKDTKDLISSLEIRLEDFSEKAKKADKFYTTVVEKFENLLSSKRKFSKGIIREQIEDLNKIRKQYTEELALKIPVIYWKEKATSHRIAAYTWGFVFFLLIALIILLSPKFLKDILDAAKAIFTTTEGNEWSIFFMITFPAFLMVWILRILSRNIITNFSHMHDASNRAIMTETFLALMSENKATDNDRILILNALFQPINSVSHEDGSPPHWFELMMERIKK